MVIILNLETFENAKSLLTEAYSKIEKTRSLVNVEGSEFYVIGDIHGDIEALQALKRVIIPGIERGAKIVFLGDYVDRGGYSFDVIMEILSLYLNHVDNVIMLRGNHETLPVNYYYGFYNELRKKFGDKGEVLYKEFNKFFSQLPIIAIINEKIMAVHGGIPNTTFNIEELRDIPKGEVEISNPTLLQLLWNDPSEDIDDWAPSPRGEGIYIFGVKPFQRFIEKNNIEMIIRAHLFFPSGYKYFFKGKLLSLFSTLKYVGYEVSGRVAKIINGEVSLIDL
jgi:diadenosine tetraphosphatase ApaH/serine/threonine PP2A family protein phosphatase